MKAISLCVVGFLGGVILFAAVTPSVPVVFRLRKTEDPPAASQAPAAPAPAPQAPAPPANPQFERAQTPADIFKLVQQLLNPPVALPPVNPPAAWPPPADVADPVGRAIAQLSSDDVFGQDAACKSLAAAKVEGARRAEVVSAVKRMIDAREPLSPRKQGVRALAVWGTAAEVPYLLGLLDDRDAGVQEAAILALGKLKDVRAADVLALRLSSGQRAAAGEALREIGPAAERVVREQLNTSFDSATRIEAIKVLKVIGTADSQKDLIELTKDTDPGVALAAREALPPKLRPPLSGPKQTVTLNVHVADYQAWPAIEARIKALADSPNPACKSNRSGEYMWVTLSPVDADLDKFARKIDFGKIVAVHTDRRLIYINSGR